MQGREERMIVLTPGQVKRILTLAQERIASLEKERDDLRKDLDEARRQIADLKEIT